MPDSTATIAPSYTTPSDTILGLQDVVAGHRQEPGVDLARLA